MSHNFISYIVEWEKNVPLNSNCVKVAFNIADVYGFGRNFKYDFCLNNYLFRVQPDRKRLTRLHPKQYKEFSACFYLILHNEIKTASNNKKNNIHKRKI